MEHLLEIPLLRYYTMYKERLNSPEIDAENYLLVFKEEFKQQLTPSIEGIVFDFGNIDTKMENSFLKKIFEFIFEETKLRKKFFIRRCNVNNLNYIKLLLAGYKLGTRS